MHTKIPSSRNLFSLTLFGFAALLFTSCTTYRYTPDNDGIYGSRTSEVETSEETETTDKNNYYKQYFKTKSQTIEDIPEDDLIFTDIEAYTTTEGIDEDGNIVIEEREYEDGYGGWGENTDDVTINIYGGGGYYGYNGGWYNPYWGYGWYRPYWGFGYGYGYPYWGIGFGYGYYNPWYCGYYGGYYNGYYRPYYGGYYGNAYATNYNRGRRNTDYATGRSRYDRNRSSISNRSSYSRSEVGRRSARATNSNSRFGNRSSVRNTRPSSRVNRNNRSSVRNTRPNSSVNRSRPNSSVNRSSRPNNSVNRSSRSNSVRRSAPSRSSGSVRSSRGGSSRSSGARRGGRGRG